MKLNTKTLTFILVALSLFLVSCSSDSGQQQSQTGAFLGGVEGVTAEFEPFGPVIDDMSTIYDSETFPIEVTLNNRGEYEIQPGDVRVTILGPSPDELEGVPSFTLENVEVMQEKSELFPQGEQETLNFAQEAFFPNDVQGFIDRTFIANVEYLYETYVIVPEVCLKGDLNDDRVCEVNEPKEFFVSGAPVTVTSVEETSSGKGLVALSIHVKKNDPQDRLAIPGEEFKVDKQDRIAFYPEDDKWECKSGGKLNEARLYNGEYDIVCKLKNTLAEDALYTEQFKLTLEYVYRDAQEQQVLRIKETSD